MENMQNMQGGAGKMVCKCPHHSVVPVLVILVGLSFLAGYWGWLSWMAVNTIWPVALIVGGATKVGSRYGMCKCC